MLPEPNNEALKERVDYLIEVILTKMTDGNEEKAKAIRWTYQALKQRVTVEEAIEFAIQHVLKMKF